MNRLGQQGQQGRLGRIVADRRRQVAIAKQNPARDVDDQNSVVTLRRSAANSRMFVGHAAGSARCGDIAVGFRGTHGPCLCRLARRPLGGAKLLRRGGLFEQLSRLGKEQIAFQQIALRGAPGRQRFGRLGQGLGLGPLQPLRGRRLISQSGVRNRTSA